MADEDIGARVDRLEQLALVLAEAQLAANEDFQKTQAQFRETDKRLRELGEKTDARIGKLVTAIGDLVSRIPRLEGGQSK